MAVTAAAVNQPTPFHVDADLKRRTEQFLATNPALSKKLDDLDRLLMGHFLQTQLQDERNGWRGTLAKAIEELERHRKLTLKAGVVDAEDEYQLRRQFTDFVDKDDNDNDGDDQDDNVNEESEEATEPDAATDSAGLQLRAQLAEAREEASAAAELAWHYENFIRELRAINAKLEARLTQLMQERRRCLKLLPPLKSDGGRGPGHSDLYKAIRELQNRQEQQTLEQQEERGRQLLTEDKQQQQQQMQQQRRVCAACGSVMSSTPHSDPPQTQHLQQHQLESDKRQHQAPGVGGTVVGWRRGGRMFSKPTDIAIVPLRPKLQHQQQQQQQQQHQNQHQQQQTSEPPTADPSLDERLTDAQTENVRLRRDLNSMTKALRLAEDDAKEKAERLAAYEKQVASMKHAFTYRQQPQEAAADVTANGGGQSSLPTLNLRQPHKRPSQQQMQVQQQQPLSDRQHVMPAKTSVTRCLRCQKLYRLVDNNKFACKYHAKGKQRREQHTSQGKLADVLFVWDCCGRLANADGCCYSQHI